MLPGTRGDAGERGALVPGTRARACGRVRAPHLGQRSGAPCPRRLPRRALAWPEGGAGAERAWGWTDGQGLAATLQAGLTLGLLVSLALSLRGVQGRWGEGCHWTEFDSSQEVLERNGPGFTAEADLRPWVTLKKCEGHWGIEGQLQRGHLTAGSLSPLGRGLFVEVASLSSLWGLIITYANGLAFIAIRVVSCNTDRFASFSDVWIGAFSKMSEYGWLHLVYWTRIRSKRPKRRWTQQKRSRSFDYMVMGMQKLWDLNHQSLPELFAEYYFFTAYIRLLFYLRNIA